MCPEARGAAGQHVLIVNETPVRKDERCWLEARTLASAGYRVTVVCPAETPEEPAAVIVEGVRVRSYAPPPKARGFWGHAWELVYCLWHSGLLAVRIRREDVFGAVHACNPPDTFFLLAAFWKLLGARFVFAQHDLVPELWFSRFNESGVRSRIVHRALLCMERLSYLVADRVVVPNESYKGVAVRRGGMAPECVHVVRNGTDLDKVMLVEPDPALRSGREHLVCYLGIMNPQDGVDYLLRAADRLVNGQGRRDVHFAFLGAGDMDEPLRRLARDLRLDDFVTFAGWVSDPDLLSRYLCTADVCVAPDPKTPLNEMSTFMKIMDYMAAATPIVAFDLAETRVSAGDAALYAVPDDIGDLAAKIGDLLDDPEMRSRMGRIGRERIESALSWAHQEPRLLAVYDELFPRISALPDGLWPERATGPVEPVVAVGDIEGNSQFLDFWRIPFVREGETAAAVSLVSARSLAERHRNAVVTLPGKGAGSLCSTPDGMTVFAPVHRIRRPPPGYEVVAPLMDRRGRVVSYILHDPAADSFVLPFSLDEALAGMQSERYAKGRRFPSRPLLRLYYTIKPLLPRPLLIRMRRWLAPVQARRRFPRWPFDDSLERLRRLALELLLRASATKELPFIWFWPRSRETCLVLTHDVETGVAQNPGIWRFVEAEEAHGLRSSFNIVPFKYRVPESLVERLRSRGCEIGVHGYSHDGDLFVRPDEFRERAERIEHVRREWKARGFRSSSTFRDADLIATLGFDYDCSFFDTDPFEPQPGGCLSLFPYFLGELVEIPMTLPQDHTLFTVRGEHDGRVWSRKLAEIRALNAMACVDVHPDEGYLGDEDKMAHYRSFLAEAAVDDGVWNPLPGELSEWWRARRAARVLVNGQGPEIEGGEAEMEIRWARLEDGRLVFETEGERSCAPLAV